MRTTKNNKRNFQETTKDSNKKQNCKKKEKFLISRGKYKGISLYLESNSITRPTKALVKKSFFDTMQDILPNKIFIECFAGSGQMGFEALSAGARQVLFFEKDMQAFKNLSNNALIFLEKQKKYVSQDNVLEFDRAQDVIKLHHEDFFHSLPILESYSSSSFMKFEKNTFSQAKNVIMASFQDNYITDNAIILYLDPPFSCRDGFKTIYDQIWYFIQSFSESLLQKVDMVIIESMSGVEFKYTFDTFQLYKKSKFGKTTLFYFKKNKKGE